MRADLLLLTSQVDHGWLRQALVQAAPATQPHVASSVAELVGMAAELPRPLRLVSILAAEVLPLALLRDFGEPAYNIHPGPPEYPGSCPEVFALYEGSTHYGVTAHQMIAQVDAGPIIAVDRFAIPPQCDRMRLARMAGMACLSLLQRLMPIFASDAAPDPCGDNWSGVRRTGKDFARLAALTADLDAAELDRRVRALDDGTGLLTLHQHGHVFRLVPSARRGAGFDGD